MAVGRSCMQLPNCALNVIKRYHLRSRSTLHLVSIAPKAQKSHSLSSLTSPAVGKTAVIDASLRSAITLYVSGNGQGVHICKEEHL